MPITAAQNLSGLAELGSSAYLLSLADRNPLPLHPALYYVGDRVGEGSINVELSEFDFMGTSLPTAIAEGASVGDSSISATRYTVTIGRYSKAYSMTDLARMADLHGLLDPTMLAQDLALSHALNLTNLIASLAPGWTAVQGTSGAALNASDLLTATQTLAAANNVGPLLGVFRSKQIHDVQTDIGFDLANGALQYDPAMAAFVGVQGSNYLGRLFGIDLFTSDRIVSDGTDYNGMVVAPGAVLWGKGTPPSALSDQAIIGDAVLFELERTARAAVTAAVSHSYVGVTRGLQARGIRIRSVD